MKVLAEVFKMPALFEIFTRIAKFKLQIGIPFTIELIKKKTTKMGLEPMLADLNGLTASRLNYSAILSIKAMNKLSFCL